MIDEPIAGFWLVLASKLSSAGKALARSVAANQVPIGPGCGLDGLVGQVFRPQQRTEDEAIKDCRDRAGWEIRRGRGPTDTKSGSSDLPVGRQVRAVGTSVVDATTRIAAPGRRAHKRNSVAREKSRANSRVAQAADRWLISRRTLEAWEAGRKLPAPTARGYLTGIIREAKKRPAG